MKKINFDIWDNYNDDKLNKKFLLPNPKKVKPILVKCHLVKNRYEK